MHTETAHRDPRGALLIALARAAIAHQLGEAVGEMPHPPWLEEPGAVFVTLTRHGELRGCIGTLSACRPLGRDLEANARAAAFDDPRFPPLGRDEWPEVRVEVSLLSAAEPMHFTDEADALAQLRPGIDGVILEYGWFRATFLPQVWDQLPEPRDFIAHLKRKAGLAPDFWAKGVKLARYTVEKFKEVET
jgi:hypothetical protein